MKIIHFLGYSGSGKTTALVTIARELTKQGLTVGTIKHVHTFTRDANGKKDSWLHANSGASIAVSLSPKEIRIEKKGPIDERMGFEKLLKIFSQERIDYLLVEGFYKTLPKKRGVLKVLCAKTEKDANELRKLHGGRLIFVTGKISTHLPKKKELSGVPILPLPENKKLAARLITESKSNASR